jgi:hypothetical protein
MSYIVPNTSVLLPEEVGSDLLQRFRSYGFQIESEGSNLRLKFERQRRFSIDGKRELNKEGWYTTFPFNYDDTEWFFDLRTEKFKGFRFICHRTNKNPEEKPPVSVSVVEF